MTARPSWCTCEPCGKRGWHTKDAAKTANRSLRQHERLSVYRCPVAPGNGWHVGHLPAVVKAGQVSRDQLQPLSVLRAQEGGQW